MKADKYYWQETLQRYRTSKYLRHYRHRHDLSYSEMARILKVSRQYIYDIEEMILKPNEEFIERLDELKMEGGAK